ncbi:MAG TPA: hypothetical protein VL403_17405, partial [Candidatus Kryptonia bacterium]|nr:hypothetical protein [Candidatus Kryptonia bacterium]
MTRAFYQELRLTLDLIGLKIDDLPHTPQSLLDWQRWARGVCAGIYRERTALRAAEYALRAEARDFESAVIRLAEAAWLAAWALLNGIKNEERGLEYLATARQLAEQVESGAARGLSQP